MKINFVTFKNHSMIKLNNKALQHSFKSHPSYYQNTHGQPHQNPHDNMSPQDAQQYRLDAYAGYHPQEPQPLHISCSQVKNIINSTDLKEYEIAKNLKQHALSFNKEYRRWPHGEGLQDVYELLEYIAAKIKNKDILASIIAAYVDNLGDILVQNPNDLTKFLKLLTNTEEGANSAVCHLGTNIKSDENGMTLYGKETNSLQFVDTLINCETSEYALLHLLDSQHICECLKNGQINLSPEENENYKQKFITLIDKLLEKYGIGYEQSYTTFRVAIIIDKYMHSIPDKDKESYESKISDIENYVNARFSNNPKSVKASNLTKKFQ